jgi:hypothetical protein
MEIYATQEIIHSNSLKMKKFLNFEGIQAVKFILEIIHSQPGLTQIR